MIKGGLRPKGIKRVGSKFRVIPRKGRLTIGRAGVSLKKRPRLAKEGKSPISKVKKAIQAQLRENAIKRDKTCVISQHLEEVPDNWKLCGNYRKDGQLIVQAEHLCGRARSRCYADMDNIVLVCMRHHFYFKTQRAPIYWEIIKKHIGEERWAKIQVWEKDTSVYRQTADDWRLKLQDLQTYSGNVTLG